MRRFGLGIVTVQFEFLIITQIATRMHARTRPLMVYILDWACKRMRFEMGGLLQGFAVLIRVVRASSWGRGSWRLRLFIKLGNRILATISNARVIEVLWICMCVMNVYVFVK